MQRLLSYTLVKAEPYTSWRRKETCIPSAILIRKPFNQKLHFDTHFTDYEIEVQRNEELHEGHTTNMEARVKTQAAYVQNLPFLTRKPLGRLPPEPTFFSQEVRLRLQPVQKHNSGASTVLAVLTSHLESL